VTLEGTLLSLFPDLAGSCTQKYVIQQTGHEFGISTPHFQIFR